VTISYEEWSACRSATAGRRPVAIGGEHGGSPHRMAEHDLVTISYKGKGTRGAEATAW